MPEFSRAVGEALSRAVPAEGTCLMIAAAYGLTDRERQVTELVAQGLSTRQVAGRLYASAYTVQDHLKSGTGSPGDLIAKLFFDHYATSLTSGDVQPAITPFRPLPPNAV